MYSAFSWAQLSVCQRLQNGHWKSLNSMTVTAALALPRLGSSSAVGAVAALGWLGLGAAGCGIPVTTVLPERPAVSMPSCTFTPTSEIKTSTSRKYVTGAWCFSPNIAPSCSDRYINPGLLVRSRQRAPACLAQLREGQLALEPLVLDD